MRTEATDERIRKLPTWARNEIALLRMRLAEAREELDKAFGPVVDIYDADLAPGIYTNEGPHGRRIGARQVRIKSEDGTRLDVGPDIGRIGVYLNGSTAFAFCPASSNAGYVREDG